MLLLRWLDQISAYGVTSSGIFSPMHLTKFVSNSDKSELLNITAIEAISNPYTW